MSGSTKKSKSSSRRSSTRKSKSSSTRKSKSSSTSSGTRRRRKKLNSVIRRKRAQQISNERRHGIDGKISDPEEQRILRELVLENSPRRGNYHLGNRARDYLTLQDLERLKQTGKRLEHVLDRNNPLNNKEYERLYDREQKGWRKKIMKKPGHIYKTPQQQRDKALREKLLQDFKKKKKKIKSRFDNYADIGDLNWRLNQSWNDLELIHEDLEDAYDEDDNPGLIADLERYNEETVLMIDSLQAQIRERHDKKRRKAIVSNAELQELYRNEGDKFKYGLLRDYRKYRAIPYNKRPKKRDPAKNKIIKNLLKIGAIHELEPDTFSSLDYQNIPIVLSPDNLKKKLNDGAKLPIRKRSDFSQTKKNRLLKRLKYLEKEDRRKAARYTARHSGLDSGASEWRPSGPPGGASSSSGFGSLD